MSTPLLVICGPTASGKTALAVALAKRFNGEVVSADSMQIYRDIRIATAKPSIEEMGGVPHHLIDFLPPEECFSVSEYAAAAHEAIAGIHRRGKLPVLCGGTGLYIDSVASNLDFEGFGTNSEVRDALLNEAAKEGKQAMWERLNDADPVLAKALHPNNIGRVIRALEVYELTGQPMSAHQKRAAEKESPYRVCKIGITFADRSLLYRRVEERVTRMFSEGLADEIREFEKHNPSKTAKQAIGYKEVTEMFNGRITLKEASEQMCIQSRRYAKRQLTWFRRDKDIKWIEADEKSFEEVASAAAKIVKGAGIIE